MPAVWDPAFRPQFYARWGRESAVISARAQRAEYAEYQQLLSIKSAFGGTEHYFIDGRWVSVDDDTFLILNAGRRYGSRIDEMHAMHSFSIFFAPLQADQALNALERPCEALLDNSPDDVGTTVVFDERLREHGNGVTSALNFIRHSLEAGANEGLWLEEQLQLLLGRMLESEYTLRRSCDIIPSAKPATRRELHRRLGLAMTYMHTFYRNRIGLADMAAAAHLSPFHFLRLFKAAYGISPSDYVNRKRALAAQRLIRSSEWTLIEIAEHVGFGSRTSLFRNLTALGGEAPHEMRSGARRRGKCGVFQR